MANVLISNLPTWTGTAADLRWYIMNNSGNTETFKFSGYTTPYKFGGTINSILNVYSSPSDIAGNYDNLIGGSGNTITNTGGFNNILSSEDSTIGGTAAKFNSIIGGQENEIASTNVGGQNYIIGGYSNQIINDSWFATILNVYNGYISNSYWSTLIGGDGNYINTNGFYGGYSAIIGGASNYITHVGTGGASSSAILGSQNSYVQNGGNSVIVGAFSSYIQGGVKNFIQSSNSSMINDVNYGAIIGGHNHGMNGGNESGIFGGYSNSMTNAQDSAILGGRGNIIDMGNACCGGNVIMGGLDNYINNSPGIYSSIIGGTTNVIRDASTNSHIIGGRNSIVSGKTDVVMLGTSARTADDEFTTYVENLRVFKQIYNGTYDVGSVSSGTTTLDFDNGNIQYFQLNAGVSATLNASNYKEGATYIVKVKQPSSGAAATLSYTSPLFKFPNGIAPTLSVNNNEEDILSFVCIGGSLYGNIQKTFS